VLSAIQSYVTKYARVIANVTKINVEVVDANFIRIAGTGLYASGVGKSISDEGEIYRHVMEIGETFYLDNPREHALCQACRNRDNCQEALLLSTPIFCRDEIAGVIGLVCFNEEERRRVQANQENYSYFLEQIADLLGHKLDDQRELIKAETFLDLMMQVVDVNNRGIIVFNTEGGITHMNRLARENLATPEGSLPKNLHIQPTGNRYSDFDEFKVVINGEERILLGQLTHLPPKDPSFASVFTFDLFSRVTQRISEFTTPDQAYGTNFIIGKSRSIVLLKTQIRRIARSSSTVLITGETGTGKELVARAIHGESDRRDKPFIAINCGAIPDTLLESEFFGYSKGAFTGADPKGKIGKFELANGGVLFLDEIGTLPIYLQAKLLRVLQDRRFTRVGSNHPIDVDIRIIAATNEDLLDLMEQGRFRKDLFYRLNVIPLEVPPLRERPEDIPVLARFFFEKYSALLGKESVTIDDAVFEALRSYRWPGNIRELENVIEFMVNMVSDSGTLHPGLLPPYLLRELGNGNLLPPATTVTGKETGPEERILPLRVLERQVIASALHHFGHDSKGKRLTAEALQISVATLYRKIKEYGLTRSGNGK